MDIFPQPQNSKRIEFNGATGNSIAVPIPKWVQFIYFWLISGGGAGGNGFSRPAGSAGGGGAGGTGSAVSRGLFPASLLRGTLYLRVGAGGVSGSGGNSLLTLDPSALLSIASGGSPAGGGAGTATGGGAGTAGSVGTISSFVMGLVTTSGATGGSGGNHTGSSGSVPSTSGLFMTQAGAGGGGCTTLDFAGGAGTIAANVPGLVASPGGILTGGNGSPGHWREDYFASAGASGGGSNNSGVGGAGGAGGGYGCGGGGGGAGVTGGAGGRGGDGRIILWYW